MENPGVPLIILGGSDGEPGSVPEGAEGYHFVVGYKGADLRVGGKCLAQILVERARASGAFGDVSIVGPARVYRGLVDCPIVDSDGHIGENVRAAVRDVVSRRGRGTAIAFMSCDILPSVPEIGRLAGELTAALEEGDGAAAFVLPLIVAGEGLGASSWKPRYRIRLWRGEEPTPFLPGHLGLVRPAMLRMGLIYRLVQLFYQERNRDYEERRRAIVLRILWTLLRRDLLNLVGFRAPTLTYRVLRHGLRTFFLWRQGELDLDGLADGAANLAVRRKHYRRAGARTVRFVISDLLSFAKDIDTREELEEIAPLLTG